MRLWWGKYEYLDKLQTKISIRGLVVWGPDVLGSRSRTFAGTRTTPSATASGGRNRGAAASRRDQEGIKAGARRLRGDRQEGQLHPRSGSESFQSLRRSH